MPSEGRPTHRTAIQFAEDLNAVGEEAGSIDEERLGVSMQRFAPVTSDVRCSSPRLR
jgi:hypothetical protein